MSIHQSHWYMVGLTYHLEGNPLPQIYSVFLPMTENYKNINHSMLLQFQNIGKDFIENENKVKIKNVILSSISYLGFMSNEEFYANK